MMRSTIAPTRRGVGKTATLAASDDNEANENNHGSPKMVE
jgi:hypothetical protein